MKILRILALLSFVAAALSCVKEGNPRVRPAIYDRSNVEVKATATLPEGWTPMSKAVSDITDIDNAELQSRGFGVYAFYTGTEEYSSATDSSAYSKFGLVLNNRKFQYTSTWGNSGKAEFWPTSDGENLTLLAYAPWDTWNDKVAYDGKAPTIQYDNFVALNLTENELSKQRDILWGTNTAGNPHRNVEKDAYDPEGTVDFHFRHATAKVSFAARGTLPGVSRSYKRSEPDGDPVDGVATYTDGTPTYGNVSYTNSSVTEVRRYQQGNRSYIEFECTRTFTRTRTTPRTERLPQTEHVKNYYAYDGKKYLVESASFKGFNRRGTLLLDNSSAYTPEWTDVEAFGGTDPEYVLEPVSGNALTPGMRFDPPATIMADVASYSGIQEEPCDMMSGYFLYAIPKTPADGADRVKVNLKYHIMNSQYEAWIAAERPRVQIRQGSLIATATYAERKTVTENSRWGYDWVDTPSVSDFRFSNTHNFSESDYVDNGGTISYGDPSYEYGEWVESGEEHTAGGASINFDDDPNGGAGVSLDGEIVTPFLGGRAYTINLIIAGDKLDLDVVPRPWELNDYEFVYNANINDVIQALTYDSSFIDYADADGNVFINNRMGKFYFKLGAGRYASWQASLVGDSAFGFTDENGNWLYESDGVTRVASIRNPIDPSVTNYIYLKAIDSSSPVTSRAKLRIYYIDATGDATVALNLVNMEGVTEWTIVQNAN
ncbi:MAG: hypothetical protein IJQ22_01435 [Bacteroidales bacterium]|nr:hypothetical protein [Bacteroidales bacterium]